jgi:catechol 2,3-dioxygenase-like lactoylglutathione lyase family enzyme
MERPRGFSLQVAHKMAGPGLIPELDVGDLARSLEFYVSLIGFAVLYEREEERFAYLTLDHAHLMLEEAAGPGRRFRTAPLERPYGRGVNFQITVADAAALHERVLAAGFVPQMPIEERWYRRDRQEIGLRQFALADPDGYLLRFVTKIRLPSL